LVQVGDGPGHVAALGVGDRPEPVTGGHVRAKLDGLGEIVDGVLPVAALEALHPAGAKLLGGGGGVRRSRVRRHPGVPVPGGAPTQHRSTQRLGAGTQIIGTSRFRAKSFALDRASDLSFSNSVSCSPSSFSSPSARSFMPWVGGPSPPAAKARSDPSWLYSLA